MATAGQRENTRNYLERMIGEGFVMRSRSTSENNVIRRTTIVGQGNAYSCGERIGQLSRHGRVSTDVGILADVQVTSGTGQYDTLTLVFEQLVAENRYGFAVYSNLKSNSTGIPLKFNSESVSVSDDFENKDNYKFYWDHTVYVKKSASVTFDSTDYTAWKALGFNGAFGSLPDRYDDEYSVFDSGDVTDKNILVIQNGQRPPADYKVLAVTGGTYDGLLLNPKLPDTKTFYHPQVSVIQTIYTTDEVIRNNILKANGTLFAPRKTDREVYDTYGIVATNAGEYNKEWLCLVTGVESQSAIHKITVEFMHRKYGWDTDIYKLVKETRDVFSQKTTSAGQPSWVTE